MNAPFVAAPTPETAPSAPAPIPAPPPEDMPLGLEGFRAFDRMTEALACSRTAGRSWRENSARTAT